MARGTADALDESSASRHRARVTGNVCVTSGGDSGGGAGSVSVCPPNDQGAFTCGALNPPHAADGAAWAHGRGRCFAARAIATSAAAESVAGAARGAHGCSGGGSSLACGHWRAHLADACSRPAQGSSLTHPASPLSYLAPQAGLLVSRRKQLRPLALSLATPLPAVRRGSRGIYCMYALEDPNVTLEGPSEIPEVHAAVAAWWAKAVELNPWACEPPKPWPPARLPSPPAAWLGAQAGLSSERSERPVPASVRAASVAAPVIFPVPPVVSAPAPTRPALAPTPAARASSDIPVGGHLNGSRRAGAAHATGVHPPASAAYAKAAAAAVPSLPLQPPPPTPAGGRCAGAVLDWPDGPRVMSLDSSRPTQAGTCRTLY
jgi:hypothetical protein